MNLIFKKGALCRSVVSVTFTLLYSHHHLLRSLASGPKLCPLDTAPGESRIIPPCICTKLCKCHAAGTRGKGSWGTTVRPLWAAPGCLGHLLGPEVGSCLHRPPLHPYQGSPKSSVVCGAFFKKYRSKWLTGQRSSVSCKLFQLMSSSAQRLRML